MQSGVSCMIFLEWGQFDPAAMCQRNPELTGRRYILWQQQRALTLSVIDHKGDWRRTRKWVSLMYQNNKYKRAGWCLVILVRMIFVYKVAIVRRIVRISMIQTHQEGYQSDDCRGWERGSWNVTVTMNPRFMNSENRLIRFCIRSKHVVLAS